MWQEARKQEKKLRGMMVDHKRRAERRREYYEKIKLDPTQFLQVHGRRSKIHLDAHVALAGDAPNTMMPWQGNKDIMIDRFDVRAHLDFIPEVKNNPNEDFDQENEKRLREINYERYRILVQNDFLKFGETKFLKTIELEEQFGGKTYQAQKAKDDKKKIKETKAAIAFTYEDSTAEVTKASKRDVAEDVEEDGEEDSDSDIDLDLTVDIMALGPDTRDDINAVGKSYRIGKGDFMKFLAQDVHEQEQLKAAKLAEEERAQHTGRKSRKERRMLRDKRLTNRRGSPPSYAAKSSTIKTFGRYPDENGPENEHESGSESSRSPSPVNAGKVEFITSFGGESESEMASDIPTQRGLSNSSRSRLKNLRRNLSRSPKRETFGPMLPKEPRSSRSRRSPSKPSASDQRRRSRRRSRSRSSSRDRRSSRSPNRRSFKRRSRSSSVSRSNRPRYRSKSPRPRSKRSPSPPRHRRKSPSPSLSSFRRSKPSPAPSKTKKRGYSDSSSSSSDEGQAQGAQSKTEPKYRSKYRNRRRSSSSESSVDRGKQIEEPLPKNGNGTSAKARSRSSSSSSTSSSSSPTSPSKRADALNPKKPIKSYYEQVRAKVGQDSDEEDLILDRDEDEGQEKSQNGSGSNDGSNNMSRDEKMQEERDGSYSNVLTSSSVKDKIKKRMQAQIKRQFRMDKLAEEERKRKLEEERMYREEEMKELALRLRRKEREKRHGDGDSDSNQGSVGAFSDQEEPRSVQAMSSNRDPKRQRYRSPDASPKKIRSRDRSRDNDDGTRRRRASSEDRGKIKLVDY